MKKIILATLILTLGGSAFCATPLIDNPRQIKAGVIEAIMAVPLLNIAIATATLRTNLTTETTTRIAADLSLAAKDVSIGIATGTLRSDLNALTLAGAALASTQTFTGENTFSNVGNVFVGDGSGLTGIPSGGGDNLGSHVATQAIDMASFPLVGATEIAMAGAGVHIATGTGIDSSGLFIQSDGAIYTTGLGNGSALPSARGTGSVDLQTFRSGTTFVASGVYSVIGGGAENTASGIYSTVAGGKSNASSEQYTAIGGGKNNIVSDQYSVVAGGNQNSVTDRYATISGGSGNIASMDYATIGGGLTNFVSSQAAVISGGSTNIADADYAAITGGYLNIANGDYSIVGGGDTNLASGAHSAILGGQMGIAGGMWSFVGGGILNNASGMMAGIAGGNGNIASNVMTFIGGGAANEASGTFATVAGGASNIASGSNAVIAGGSGNKARGSLSSILGGQYNEANGDNSFAGGTLSSSSAMGSFTWADSEAVVVDNTVIDRTWFKNRGGFLISTTTVAGDAQFEVNTTQVLIRGDLAVSGTSFAGLVIVSSSCVADTSCVATCGAGTSALGGSCASGLTVTPLDGTLGATSYTCATGVAAALEAKVSCARIGN